MICKTILKKVLALVNAVLFSCLILELTVRAVPQLLPEQVSSPLLEKHDILGKWYRPNLVTSVSGMCYQSTLHFNEIGSRSLSLEVLKSKPQAWLFVGDSMLLAQQVENEQLFTSLLQSKFPNVAVINLGKASSGPNNYNQVLDYFLKDKKIHSNPTQIVYFITPDTDWNDLLSPSVDPSSTSSWKSIIRDSLRIYEAGYYLYFKIRDNILDVKNTYFKSVNRDLPIYAYDSNENSKVIVILEKVFSELRGLAQREKIQVSIILMPTLAQVSNGLDSPIYLYPSSRINKLADQYGLSFFDLTGAVIRDAQTTHENPVDLFLPCEGHLSVKGHRELAELLADYLNQQKMLTS